MNKARPLRRRASLELTFFFSLAFSISSFSFYELVLFVSLYLLTLHPFLFPLSKSLGSNRSQIGMRQLWSLLFISPSQWYQIFNVLQSHHVLILSSICFTHCRFCLTFSTTLVHISLRKSMTIFATSDERGHFLVLRTIRTLPEPAITLLLNSIQEVFADNFGCRLRTFPSFWRNTSSNLSRSQSAFVSCAFSIAMIRMNTFFADFRVLRFRSWLYLHLSPLSQRPALKKGQRTDLGSSPKAS